MVQTSVKYESETRVIPLGDRTFTIVNLTPILSPKEREQRKKEIEKQLFDVFVKYTNKA